MLPSEADLQLLFARLNCAYFDGEVPDCRIRYNERFRNAAGRITYTTPVPLIELSPKHFRIHPEALEETLLHEMIHAWCAHRFGERGHGPNFRRMMRRCGISSIHHEMGAVKPLHESPRRYILRCERCAFETLRKRRPARPASCPSCNRRRFDPRFPLTVYEVVQVRPAGTTVPERAACDGPRREAVQT
jgi:hypothetical protein